MKYVKQHFVTGIFLSTPSARRATTASLVSTAAGSYFYPRPPRGGRPNTLTIGSEAWLFLSTPSARRATQAVPAPHLRLQDFYPRPPRGGRPPALFSSSRHARISIHALREEGDRSGSRSGRARPISIHALREEGDPP